MKLQIFLKWFLISILIMVLTACDSNSNPVGDSSASAETPAVQNFPCNTSMSIEGKVISVIDGDTITLLDEYNAEHKIRLSCIDAPEKNQDFGQVSKDRLSTLISAQNVVVYFSEIDKYGRILGYIDTGNRLANLEQVKNGMAWVYREYCNDCAYYDAEKYARNNNLGIWAQSNPTPPWEFRKDEDGSQGKDYSHLYNDTCVRNDTCGEDYNDDEYVCGKKRYCTEMNSCEEVMYYYETCNLTSLDRDNDGIPCESLCL